MEMNKKATIAFLAIILFYRCMYQSNISDLFEFEHTAVNTTDGDFMAQYSVMHLMCD